jgi:hypothetical protein
VTWTPDTSRLDAERAKKAAAQMDGLPLLAPHNGTETSKAAARELTQAERQERKDRIVAALLASPAGLTREELVVATGLKENSVNSACNACVREGLAVEDEDLWLRGRRKIVYHPSHAPTRQAAA